MKKLLSLCAVVMLFTFADHALAGGHRGMNGMGHFGHHGGMHNGGGYGGQQYAGGGYRGGRFRNNGGYGAGYNYGGGYYGNGGYGAGYNYGSDYGDVVVVGGDDMPEQIYVYRQAPMMPYILIGTIATAAAASNGNTSSLISFGQSGICE